MRGIEGRGGIVVGLDAVDHYENRPRAKLEPVLAITLLIIV
jgi:hypothetical protein